MDVPTTGSAPITTSDQITKGTTENPGAINNGDSAMFFDDLGKTEPAKPKKADPEKKADLPAEAVEALKSGKEDKKTDKPDLKSEKSESKSGKNEPEKKANDEKDQSKDKEKVEAKKLKAKFQDREIEIEEDALVTVSIDGKEETISLKDLRSHYSGKVHYDKKFSELDKERKTFIQKSKQAEERIKSIFDEQDPDLKFYKLAQFAGKDPMKMRQQYIQDNIKTLETYASMTESERKQADLEFENKILKYNADTDSKAKSARDAQDALHKEIAELAGRHKFTQDEFLQAHDQVEALINTGKLEADKLTPKFISEVIQKDKLWASAEAAIQEMGIELKNPAQTLFTLVDSCFAQGITPDAMKEVISEQWGPKKTAKNIEAKTKQREEFYGGKPTTPAPSQGSDAMFFDDL